MIGRGYYQLLKAEKIQEYKNIILEDSIGRMWEGSGVRNIFGIPNDSNNNKLSIKLTISATAAVRTQQKQFSLKFYLS